MPKLILTILALALLPAAGFPQSRKDNWENLKQLQPGHKIKVVAMDLQAWDWRLISVSDVGITIREKASPSVAWKGQEITCERAKVLRVTDLERSKR